MTTRKSFGWLVPKGRCQRERKVISQRQLNARRSSEWHCWVNGVHVPPSFKISCGYDQLTIGIAIRRLQWQTQAEKPFEYSSGYKRTSDGGLLTLRSGGVENLLYIHTWRWSPSGQSIMLWAYDVNVYMLGKLVILLIPAEWFIMSDESI